MTKTNNTIKWLLPAVALLLSAILFAGMPAYAVEASNTTGETEATVSFTAGELKLETVPMLDFGGHDISNEQQEYAATSVSPDVKVSDLRGKGTGWNLFVSLSSFKLESDSSETLKAASIQFTSPSVDALNGTVGTKPAAGENLVLTSDNTETPVWTAASGQGMGVWGLGWAKENVKLNVKPGTAEEGKSVASLTWSLQTTP